MPGVFRLRRGPLLAPIHTMEHLADWPALFEWITRPNLEGGACVETNYFEAETAGVHSRDLASYLRSRFLCGHRLPHAGGPKRWFVLEPWALAPP